jgi:hypothetical protein
MRAAATAATDPMLLRGGEWTACVFIQLTIISMARLVDRGDIGLRKLSGWPVKNLDQIFLIVCGPQRVTSGGRDNRGLASGLPPTADVTSAEAMVG